jgi:hypothetical protein
MWSLKEGRNERCVCPARERRGRTGGEPSSRVISPHPNLETQSGLRALERALAESHQGLKAAQAVANADSRRRALAVAARDARYFAERLASAVLQP